MLGHLRATGDQAKLFYEFCLEDRVPSNHLLRKIDRFVDLSELRAHLTSLHDTDPRVSIFISFFYSARVLFPYIP